MDRVFRPPAYAWDWFARQHLLWREVRRQLALPGRATRARYAEADSKTDVMALLRSDYTRDEEVREAVCAVIGEVAFLGRTDAPFARLGVRNAPRGMRWWWTALTGEALDVPPRPVARPSQLQLTLEQVHEGYGD